MAELSAIERIKAASRGLRGTIVESLADPITGALTLTAKPGQVPTVADYEAALRSVTYTDTSGNAQTAANYAVQWVGKLNVSAAAAALLYGILQSRVDRAP